MVMCASSASQEKLTVWLAVVARIVAAVDFFGQILCILGCDGYFLILT